MCGIVSSESQGPGTRKEKTYVRDKKGQISAIDYPSISM